MELNDKQLVTKIISGDSSSFSKLFEKYKSKIYNFAYSIVNNKEDAKDISQEAFIKAYEALPKVAKDLNFSAYLYKITRNLAIDQTRKRKRQASPEAIDIKEDIDLNISPQKKSLLKEQQIQVRKAAMSLPQDYKTILALRELENQSYDEISEVMEIPKNSVGVLLLRARLRFKEVFRMNQVDVEKLTKECKDMLPLLSGYIDSELGDDQQEKLKAHLDECPLCRLALEEMTEASKSYRAIIPLMIPMIPDTVKGEVLSKIDQMAHTTQPINNSTLGSSEAKTTIKSPNTSQTSEAPTTAINTPPGSSKTKAASSNNSMFSKLKSLSKPKKILLTSLLILFLTGGLIGGVYAVKTYNKNKIVPKQQTKTTDDSTIEKTKKVEEPTFAKPRESTKSNEESTEPEPEEEVEIPAEDPEEPVEQPDEDLDLPDEGSGDSEQDDQPDNGQPDDEYKEPYDE